MWKVLCIKEEYDILKFQASEAKRFGLRLKKQ